MYGPPGTGKTMLAKAFSTILPPLSYEEILEVTGIHSLAQILSEPFITEPPFRAPHHTASYASLVGGGPFPRPGEITLWHIMEYFSSMNFPNLIRASLMHSVSRSRIESLRFLAREGLSHFLRNAFSLPQ
jgi:hypothetical protein